MANFKKLTRYTNGNIDKNRTGLNFIVLRRPLFLPEASNDTFINIGQDLINRPDLISYKAYGTTDLWWAIYEYNNIRDPLFDLQIGQIIKIPQLQRLTDAIEAMNK
jgi:hypothetical protein